MEREYFYEDERATHKKYHKYGEKCASFRCKCDTDISKRLEEMGRQQRIQRMAIEQWKNEKIEHVAENVDQIR